MTTEPHNSELVHTSGVYRIHITHYSDQEFLDAFRADLANCAEQVIILSPFLSQNRAIHYYPAMLSLAARHVVVEVYAKPENEQPESLREHFGWVADGLRRAGVRFYTRPGMHEKVGVIDNRILWHGSLNILSHNDTRESMLRFESSDLVQEVLTDLQLIPQDVWLDASHPPQLDTEHPAEKENSAEVPVCPRCGGRMLLFENAGMWLCQNSPACRGSLALDAAALPMGSATGERKRTRQVEISCPICGLPMEVSRGLFLRVACSSDQCGFALDPRIASSLLRVLKRKGVV